VVIPEMVPLPASN